MQVCTEKNLYRSQVYISGVSFKVYQPYFIFSFLAHVFWTPNIFVELLSNPGGADTDLTTSYSANIGQPIFPLKLSKEVNIFFLIIFTDPLSMHVKGKIRLSRLLSAEAILLCCGLPMQPVGACCFLNNWVQNYIPCSDTQPPGLVSPLCFHIYPCFWKKQNFKIC